MPNEDQAPARRGDSGSGWLLQPFYDEDLFSEIAEAERITPEVLSTLELALATSRKNASVTPQFVCTKLTDCATFEAKPDDCPKLVNCGTLTNPKPTLPTPTPTH